MEIEDYNKAKAIVETVNELEKCYNTTEHDLMLTIVGEHRVSINIKSLEFRKEIDKAIKAEIKRLENEMEKI